MLNATGKVKDKTQRLERGIATNLHKRMGLLVSGDGH